MKILGLSDLHGNLLNNIPECDILCICGDTIELNIQRNVQQSEYWWKHKFVDWCNKLPCKKIIVIAGNHDFVWEHFHKQGTYKEFKDDLFIRSSGKIICLLDESYIYDGITFYGTPWIEPITFQPDKWAFSSQEHWNIPDCDILLTHDSPVYNDILNYAVTGKYKKAHLFGHWHDGRSILSANQYNCSRLDDYYRYKKNYKYVIINVMTESEKKQVEQEFLQKIIFDIHKELETADTATKLTLYSRMEECLLKYKDPVIRQDKEDEVEWDTNAIGDSALITDIET